MSAHFQRVWGLLAALFPATQKSPNLFRHKASSFIFTAALPPASVAGVTKALDIMINEPDRLKRLRENTSYVKKGFFNMGFQVNNNSVPIVPIKVGDEALTLQMNQLLFEDGVFAGVAIPPCCSSSQPHDPNQFYLLVTIAKIWIRFWHPLAKFGKRLGVITR